MTSRELIDICLAMPMAYEDYPFDNGDAHSDDGSWAVIKHRANKKGFAHVYERGGKLCVNLKCDPFESDVLRQMFADVTPAYHMNKTHWNTVTPGGDVPGEEVRRMIEMSYDLVKPKTRRRDLGLTEE